jgi:hypothetical protein
VIEILCQHPSCFSRFWRHAFRVASQYACPRSINSNCIQSQSTAFCSLLLAGITCFQRFGTKISLQREFFGLTLRITPRKAPYEKPTTYASFLRKEQTRTYLATSKETGWLLLNETPGCLLDYGCNCQPKDSVCKASEGPLETRITYLSKWSDKCTQSQAADHLGHRRTSSVQRQPLLSPILPGLEVSESKRLSGPTFSFTYALKKSLIWYSSLPIRSSVGSFT